VPLEIDLEALELHVDLRDAPDALALHLDDRALFVEEEALESAEFRPGLVRVVSACRQARHLDQAFEVGVTFVLRTHRRHQGWVDSAGANQHRAGFLQHPKAGIPSPVPSQLVIPQLEKGLCSIFFAIAHKGAGDAGKVGDVVGPFGHRREPMVLELVELRFTDHLVHARGDGHGRLLYHGSGSV